MQLGVSLGIPSTLGKVAAAFSPLDLSPFLWLDAADTSTITEVAGAVSQWDDKSGNGYHVTQATAANQPTTGATTQNGKNVVDFAADFMTYTPGSDFLFTVDGTTYLIAVVVKPGTSADPNALYYIMGSSGTGAQTGFNIAFDDRASISRNNRIIHTVFNGGFTAPVSNVSADDALAANTMQIATVLADPDNATGANRSSIFVDAGTAIANNTSTAAVAASITNAFSVGGPSASPLTGSIAEIVICTGANATEANRQALRDYLNDKWAVY